MKALHMLLVFICISISLLGVVRESTIEGGNWSAPGTWVGNVVPATTDDVVINGSVIVNLGVYCNNLTVNSIGTLMNYSGANYWIAVYGNFVNYGNCLNNPGGGSFDLDLRGDFSNYYIITNRLIYLNKSSGIMNLYQDANAAPLSCQQLLGQSSAAGYRLISDWQFNNVLVDFSGKNVYMYNGRAAYDISLDGGRLYRAELKTNGYSLLTLNNGAYLYNVNAGDIVFHGNGLIYIGVSFDNLTVDYYSTLSAYTGGTYDLTVNEDLICYGYINNGVGNIYLRLYGDLFYHNGQISCYYVYFMGTGTQHLDQGIFAAPFVVNRLGKPSTVTLGELILLNDLVTHNTIVDLNYCDIVCYSGGETHNLIIDGGYIYRTDLVTNGFSKLTMSGGAYLYYVNAGDFILDGTTMPYAEVYFDDVVNQGLIQSYYGINNLVINGVLHNWYNIIDAEGSDLYLHIKGDLYNNGNVNCARVYLDGAGNQYLQLGGGFVFTAGDIFLISNWGSAQFWFNDSLVYQGNTYYDIQVPNLGVWKIVAGINQRFVTIGEGSGITLPAPQITSFAKVDEVIHMVWNEVPGAFYYMVFASDVPYGDYPDFYYVWDAEIGDGIVSYVIYPVQDKRFYRVYAHH